MMRSVYKNALTLLAILLALGLIYLFLVPSKGIIVLKGLSRDTCILLRKENGDTVWASRHARILKNTFHDTLSLDGGILFPLETGEHTNLQTKDRDGNWGMLYDPGNIDLPKTDQFCLRLRKIENPQGELIIEYYY